MKYFVTGGAGFLGSNFVDALLAAGHDVQVFDDFSTGRELFLEDAMRSPKLTISRGDIREHEQVLAAMQKQSPEWVIHLAANADVRLGLERPRRDLDYNTIGTWNVVEAARKSGVRAFFFSSTGSVYGEPEVFPTPENAPFPTQTSLYGAAKLAGEAIISAYATGYGMKGVVMRFVSILGPRYSHGHVFDFVKSLKRDPKALKVLGDGTQTKSYLHVSDLVRGAMRVMERANGDSPLFEVFNIGHRDTLTVKQSIGYITARMGLSPELVYSGGKRGWVGDSPRIELDTTRLRGLGWETTLALKRSVEDTVDYLLANQQLLEL